jgi:hypothetical protein
VPLSHLIEYIDEKPHSVTEKPSTPQQPFVALCEVFHWSCWGGIGWLLGTNQRTECRSFISRQRETQSACNAVFINLKTTWYVSAAVSSGVASAGRGVFDGRVGARITARRARESLPLEASRQRENDAVKVEHERESQLVRTDQHGPTARPQSTCRFAANRGSSAQKPASR